jgi:hypothetical protein
VEVWTFIWLLLILKIPIVGLLLLVRWAVRQEPETEAAGGTDGGVGPASKPLAPTHPRPSLPRHPRRGPHGEPAPASPSRVRTVTVRTGKTLH